MGIGLGRRSSGALAVRKRRAPVHGTPRHCDRGRDLPYQGWLSWRGLCLAAKRSRSGLRS
jgi:hypothetical protein